MTAGELIEAIERLIDEPVPNHDTWLAKGGFMEQALAVKPRISDGFWHYLHHYLSDDDIRRADVAYKQHQDAALRRFLEGYKQAVNS